MNTIFGRLWSPLLVFAILGAPPANADDHAARDDVQRLADRIDELVADRWEAADATPAPPIDDAAFLRRVSLDIAGAIPAVSDLRRFVGDESADKRRAKVDELLESPGYIINFTNYWRRTMLPETQADFQIRILIPSFEAWLREKLAKNATYDELVQEIITTPLATGNRRRNPYEQAGELTPIAFYQAKQIAPENLAAATSRIFLGIRIECAQCHHHPFDTWQQEEFWSFAAFFAGLQRQNENQGVFGAVSELLDRREIKIPNTETVVPAKYLDGEDPQWQARVSPRQTLADWITSKDNPYFAKTAANRVWGHFFGRGLVDPVDDFTTGNPCSHPDLLDELARAFVEHDYDLKHLIRAITASRTYQLSSLQTHESQQRPSLFARMAVKGLTPEQIFDSLAQATGYYQQFQGGRNAFAVNNNSPRSRFVELFTNDSDTTIERQTTILQALAMMNGQFTQTATDRQQSQTLAAVIEFPLMTDVERIETLYFAALSRPPREDELERLVPYVESGGATQDRGRALGDVFWALLNSSEFMFNH